MIVDPVLSHIPTIMRIQLMISMMITGGPGQDIGISGRVDHRPHEWDVLSLFRIAVSSATSHLITEDIEDT
jgi:hypothetical protein